MRALSGSRASARADSGAGGAQCSPMPAARNHGPFTDPTVPFNDEMDSSWMAVRYRCAKLSLSTQLKPFQKESVDAL